MIALDQTSNSEISLCIVIIGKLDVNMQCLEKNN